MDKRRNLARKISKYKVAIFDLDGTLVNLNVDWEKLKNDLSAFCSRKTGENIVFTPLDEKILYVKKKFGKKLYKKLLEIISAHEMDESRYALNKELLGFICETKQKVAIYSMNTEKCINNFVAKYFKRKPDAVISKETCIKPKPSKKDLLKLLKRIGMKKNEAIFVGDSEVDKLSGKMAGIKTLIIKN